MPRLIDADELAKKMQFLIRTHHRDAFDALNEIDKAPTIASESLRPQGEWTIKYDEYDCEYAVCSCCGAEFYALDEDTIDITYNYYPDCGAYMKGAGEDA